MAGSTFELMPDSTPAALRPVEDHLLCRVLHIFVAMGKHHIGVHLPVVTLVAPAAVKMDLHVLQEAQGRQRRLHI